MDWHLCGRDPACNFCPEFTIAEGHPSARNPIASTSKKYDGSVEDENTDANLIKRGACQNRNRERYDRSKRKMLEWPR